MVLVKKLAATITFIAFAGVAATVVWPQPARGSGSEPVTVVNTPGHPVPVTGTMKVVSGSVDATVTGNVGLTGTPTVLAQQSGPWTVGLSNNSVTLAGTPTVIIGNAATSPVPVRDADNAARSPFAGYCIATGQPSMSLTPNCTIAVPPGARLVVEYVSANMGFISGILGSLAVDATSNGQGSRALFQPARDPVTYYGGVSQAVIGSQARIYSDPGTALTFYFFTENNAIVFGPSGFAYVSGYLVTP